MDDATKDRLKATYARDGLRALVHEATNEKLPLTAVSKAVEVSVARLLGAAEVMGVTWKRAAAGRLPRSTVDCIKSMLTEAEIADLPAKPNWGSVALRLVEDGRLAPRRASHAMAQAAE